jgi:hypothetical protein
MVMQKRQEDLLNDLNLLLGDLCRDFGFCNRLTAAELRERLSGIRISQMRFFVPRI